jgi:hypothetical protein
MSTNATLCCHDDSARRARARESAVNGLDYVEVSCDESEFAVYFLGKAPDWEIQPRQLRIEGGQRIRDIRVLEVTIDRNEDPDLDDVMRIRVDRAGDFSTYTLCLYALDPQTGRVLESAPADFDPRYACVCFSFRAACANGVDCVSPDLCDPPVLAEPDIDYVARDYATFRRLILDRLALVCPEWTERHVPDLGITLVELLAYTGDQLSYYQDAVATEAYLDTARLRISVRRHARLVDYTLHEGCNARAWLHLEVSQDHSLKLAEVYFLTHADGLESPMLREDKLPAAGAESWLVFEPLHGAHPASLSLRLAHNEIHFHTWGESGCCIPRGATSATLLDGGTENQYRLQLAPGDFLLFEEVLGPRTAVPADADPQKRHVVRLTRVMRGRDRISGELIVDIEWCDEDALPFALCLSVTSPPPDCEPVANVSVARGNLLLVDHGLSVEEDLDPVPGKHLPPRCPDACDAGDREDVPDRFAPVLKHPDITHAGNLPDHRHRQDHCGARAATRQLVADCRRALPAVRLQGSDGEWTARGDLLSSGADDRHFVVEVDDDGKAHLRFGDNDCGRAPRVGETLRARYRIGNGLQGNVGAESIRHVVFRDAFPSGLTIRPRNPLAAAGGVAAELVGEAKLRAPYLFRQRLERAVTAEDYAAIVTRDFTSEVQRAAAVMRWNGSGPEVLVAVDARDNGRGLEGGAALRERISRHLRDFRRIGHDVHVIDARHVPLDLALTICVLPGHLAGHVRSAVLAALGSRRLPGGRSGFFHADNLTFGEGIFVSRIIATVQAVPGVASVVVDRLERLGEGPYGEREEGVLPLGPMEVAKLDADPNFPEHGVLTLTMRGGR